VEKKKKKGQRDVSGRGK